MSTRAFTEMSTTRAVSDIARNAMPAGYHEVARRSVIVDGEDAELVRYQPQDDVNITLGGEHFSTLIASDGRLKGFARMHPSLVGDHLPSPDEAKAIALDFLAVVACDLLPVFSVHWIRPHDERLNIMKDGEEKNVLITGMKVKMQNISDGRWMWVIVGSDHKVMVFERDIVWMTFPGHRKTEKWLHDSWLAEKGYSLGHDS